MLDWCLCLILWRQGDTPLFGTSCVFIIWFLICFAKLSGEVPSIEASLPGDFESVFSTWDLTRRVDVEYRGRFRPSENCSIA
jgi:hypothetical protein